MSGFTISFILRACVSGCKSRVPYGSRDMIVVCRTRSPVIIANVGSEGGVWSRLGMFYVVNSPLP